MSRYPKGSCPKLTLKLIEEVTLLLKRGAYIETAAAACSISKDTFYRWLKNGKNGTSSIEKKLSDAVLRALAEAEIRDLDIIGKAAQGYPDQLAKDENGNLLYDSKGSPIVVEYGNPPNWRAAAWRLERRYSQRWRKETDYGESLESPECDTIVVEFVGLDDED